MNESPVKCCQNPVYENVDKPASLELSKLAQGSNRALFALVINVCLISLVALLLTILILVGKTGSSNEAKTRDYDQSLLAMVKAREENITSLRLGLDPNKSSAHIEAVDRRNGVTYQGKTAIISSQWLPINILRRILLCCNKNFSRPSFALFLCVVILTASVSRAKPQNSSVKTNPDKSFVVDNYCGLAKSESELLVLIKAKVDSIAATSSKEAVCPDGWVLHVNSCFLVIDIPTLEWSDARRNCQKLGGDLAKITSGAENQFIFDLVTKQKKITDGGVWLGLHRKADNKFYWADDTLLAGYSNWYTGEPNNVAEKCGHMFSKRPAKGKWNDYYCSSRYGSNSPVVLCQKKAKHQYFVFALSAGEKVL